MAAVAMGGVSVGRGAAPVILPVVGERGPVIDIQKGLVVPKGLSLLVGVYGEKYVDDDGKSAIDHRILITTEYVEDKSRPMGKRTAQRLANLMVAMLQECGADAERSDGD